MKFRTDLILRQFGDEYIIVDPGQDQLDLSKIIRFNATAAEVWHDLQAETLSVPIIAKLLQQYYDVEIGPAERDAKNLLAQFERNDLLMKE